MAKPEAIHRYWLTERPDVADEVFGQCDLGEPSCYACGWASADESTPYDFLQRGHIIDDRLGGSPEASNLTLICVSCHVVMPPFAPGHEADALEWFALRPSWIELGMPAAKAIARHLEATGALPTWLVERERAHPVPGVPSAQEAAAVYLASVAAERGELFPA